MKKNIPGHYDIIIAGAGFAGSLMALILQKTGLNVCLLEKGKHPRFAIGESSTPVADMILRKLSIEYNLPWLHDFSRYGSWQKSHPEIVCGIKRGFCFFKQYPGKNFTTDKNHLNELFVAASSSDMQSDTNWLRSDVDAFFVEKVKEYGVTYLDLAEIVKAERSHDWKFEIERLEYNYAIHSSFFIDATGNSSLSEKLMGNGGSSHEFLTNSFAIFSHFENVPHWAEILKKNKISMSDYPFNPDLSALHQILDEGWMWMLRFNDNRTSVGFVVDNEKNNYDELSTEDLWNGFLQKYPAVRSILNDSNLHFTPGKIIRSRRLQRKMKKCFGEGWVALPHTAGFVDPLFSSGIAHTLSGIEKLAEIFKRFPETDDEFYNNLYEYQKGIFEELRLIDCLVAGCYKTMYCFELFVSWSMLYFAASIAHEHSRMNGRDSRLFLNADDVHIQRIVFDSYEDLLKIVSSGTPSADEIKAFTAIIKKRIEPFNTAGLLDPSFKNMYRHTIAAI